MKISHSININCSPKKTFYWLEEPERARQWMTNVIHYKIIKENPNRVGTTFIETIEDNGQQLEMMGELTDFIQDKKLAFHLESKVHTVEVEFNLERDGKKTILTQNAEIHFKGFMKEMIFLFGFLFKKKIINQTKHEFNILKEICEGNVTSEKFD